MKWQFALTRAGISIALFCILGAATGSAATVCTDTTGTRMVCTSDAFSGVNNFQTSLLFPYFDGSMGTLESVTFTFGESASGSVTITNQLNIFFPSIADRSFELSSNVTLSVPASPAWTINSATTTWQGTTPNVIVWPATPRTITAPQAVTGGASATRDTGLGGFLGSGFFSVGLGVTTSYTPPSPALPWSLSSAYNWTTTGSVVMTYDYLPAAPPPPPAETPEPAALVLFGSALLSLGLVRKRIQR